MKRSLKKHSYFYRNCFSQDLVNIDIQIIYGKEMCAGNQLAWIWLNGVLSWLWFLKNDTFEIVSAPITQIFPHDFNLNNYGARNCVLLKDICSIWYIPQNKYHIIQVHFEKVLCFKLNAYLAEVKCCQHSGPTLPPHRLQWKIYKNLGNMNATY